MHEWRWTFCSHGRVLGTRVEERPRRHRRASCNCHSSQDIPSLHHKTKQGGAQSANDNAKGNAHSAGSSIRRYNEMALELDIRGVLSEWRAMIDSAELIFIRATGSANRRTLFGPYEGQVLRSNDKRIRGFPFSTRRATQAELLRSFQELTRLKVGKLVEPVAEKAPAEKGTSKAHTPKPEVPKLSKEEEAALFHTSQLEALIRRSKAPGVLLYLTKNELSPDFTFFPAAEHHHAPNPLHLSASTNSPALNTSSTHQSQVESDHHKWRWQNCLRHRRRGQNTRRISNCSSSTWRECIRLVRCACPFANISRRLRRKSGTRSSRVECC